MHPSAMMNAKFFFDTYSEHFARTSETRVVDVGSQDVNGSLRSACPTEFSYIGCDFVEGKGVDIVLDDPYTLPFDSESFDIALSSSCFEHSEMFWLSFLEIMRVLKPNGLFYLNVPSNGSFHRYPVDCWRFYPDSGDALASWGRRNGMKTVCLESYTSGQNIEVWNDFVSIFAKDETSLERYKRRVIDEHKDYTNGKRFGEIEYSNYSRHNEDRLKLLAIAQILNNQLKIR